MLTIKEAPPTVEAGRRDAGQTTPSGPIGPRRNQTHAPASLTTDSPAYVWPTLLLLGTAYALANGLGYGAGNLWQYLLHGRHLLDPTFLANDWLTSRPQPHHLAFAYGIAIVGRFLPLDTAFAWANAAAAIACVVCVFALAARYYRAPVVVTAVTLLIIVFSPHSHIGMSNLLMPYFQPSTIGGVGLLAGLTCLIYQRYKTAGALFFISGLFHLGYMVWAVIIVGAVLLLNWGRKDDAGDLPPSVPEGEGHENPSQNPENPPAGSRCPRGLGLDSKSGKLPSRLGWRQSLYVVVPIGLTAVYHLPIFLASRVPEQTPHAAAAARILHDIYMPGHSRPLTWGLDPFIRFASILAAGLLAYKAAGTERKPGRIALSILGTISAIIGIGILLTTVVQVDTVALLLPYRLAPFLILAAHIACAGALTTTAQWPRLSMPKTLLLWALMAALLYGSGLRTGYGLSCVLVSITALLGGRIATERRVPLWMWGVISVTLLVVMAWAGAGRTGIACAGGFLAIGIAWRAAIHRDRPSGVLAWLPHVGGAILPLLIAAFMMQVGAARKDFLGPPPPADEQTLYQWCRARTARDDVFIIPPSLSGFRLGAERAIVIDSRCITIQSSEIVEWYDRLRAECGGDFGSLPEADARYATMDAARAQNVARRYGARYVVIRVGSHQDDLSSLRRVYRNPQFAVYDLGDSGATAKE